MLRLAADENFNNNIVRGLLCRKADLDIVRVQDVGLSGVDDPTVFEWAAQEGRALLTHDVTTITRYAYERVQAGQTMPGVFEVSRTIPIGQVIEDVLLLAECSLSRSKIALAGPPQRRTACWAGVSSDQNADSGPLGA